MFIFKKNLKTSVYTLLVISYLVFFANLIPVSQALAQTNNLSLDIKTTYPKKVLSFWLKDQSGQFLAYQESIKNSTSFKNLDSSQYTLEIWEKEILKNADLYQNPTPIYSKKINLATSSLKLNLSFPVKKYQIFKATTSKKDEICGGKKYNTCPTGLNFSCEKNIGYCLKIGRKTNINTKELAQQIHALLNYYRQQHNLPRLTWKDNLAEAAGQHSEDMAKRNFFDFTDPKGCDIVCRFNRQPKIQSLFAENISLRHWQQNTYKNGVVAKYNTQFYIAESIASAWEKDEKGNRIIYSRRYREQGIGSYLDKNGEIYTTQDLSNSLTSAEEKDLQKITLSLINKDDTQEEKIRRVYNWITTNIRYDVGAKDNNDDKHWSSYSLTGAYRQKLAVCQGYTELLRLMLSYLGINAPIITGNVESFGQTENHAWNKVVLDNKTYYLDPTWDSGHLDEKGNFKAESRTAYFLKPLTCFKVNHAQAGEKLLDKKERAEYIARYSDLFNNTCAEIKKDNLVN